MSFGSPIIDVVQAKNEGDAEEVPCPVICVSVVRRTSISESQAMKTGLLNP